jgi:hypothetical protein
VSIPPFTADYCDRCRRVFAVIELVPVDDGAAAGWLLCNGCWPEREAFLADRRHQAVEEVAA